jgi:hypothetical protein
MRVFDMKNNRRAEWMEEKANTLPEQIEKLELLASNYSCMTRQHEIKSKCRRYSVIYRCGGDSDVDWRTRKDEEKGKKMSSRCLFSHFLGIYLHIEGADLPSPTASSLLQALE